jgi:hypothetical protein
MKKSIVMALVLTALSGCSEAEREVDVDANGNPIGRVPVQLTGVIETVDTRGAGVIDAILGTGLQLDLFRANANASGAYTGYATTSSDVIKGTLQSSGAITFDTNHEQYWDGSGNKSSFIAVYPRGLTYNQSAKTLTGTLDGSTDLMSSELKEGSKAAATISLKLKHLLAKVEVKVSVAAGAVATWGDKIKGIELIEQKNSVSLLLPTPVTPPANLTVTPTFSGTTGAYALTSASGAALGEVSLATSSTPYGYVMFAPGTQELKFKVRTTNESTGVTVSVASKNYQAGRGYTLIFTFTPSGGGTGIGVAVAESAADGGLEGWTPDGGGDTAVGL